MRWSMYILQPCTYETCVSMCISLRINQVHVEEEHATSTVVKVSCVLEYWTMHWLYIQLNKIILSHAKSSKSVYGV